MAIQVAFALFAFYIYHLHIMKTKEKKEVRLHLTNIVGLGAVQLVESLLPSLLGSSNYSVGEIYLPSHNKFSQLLANHKNNRLIPYKRYLPNSISRILECTLFGGKFNGVTPLLVMGDIPIRCSTRQVVFVQSSLLTNTANNGRKLGAVKYWIARWLFQSNLKFASAFIVQTEAMKSALIATYPTIKDLVHVIAQPAPAWLVASHLKRTKPSSGSNSGLRLFYPAAVYPHKNHRLLGQIKSKQINLWPITELILTIPENQNPNPSLSWAYCVDRLTPDQVIRAYEQTDALLFLSNSESFGFPLIEAMWIGLPIICPDLPYARTLCGDQAIYFNPNQIDSLHAAIIELDKRLKSSWWPDWSEALSKIPHNWEEVAETMFGVITK